MKHDRNQQRDGGNDHAHTDRGSPADGGRNDDHDDERPSGGGGPLEPLDKGLEARLAGKQPSPESIALAQSHGYSGPAAAELMTRWNHIGGGSQNIAPEARAVLSDWRWHVELSRVWRAQGLFGREFGANSIDYAQTVLRSMVWALTAAEVAGDTKGADDIRIAVRAAIFYFALCSVNVVRRHSTWLSTDDRFPGDEVDHANPQAPTAAAAGMRWTVRRGGHDGDAASNVLRGALANPGWWGLTSDERELLKRIVFDTDLAVMSQVARHVDRGGWLFGIIDTPAVRWHIRVRRTTDGVEALNDSDYPNGNTKQCCGVTIMRLDGKWISVRAWPNGWHVEDDGASIVVRSLGNHDQPVKPGVVSVARLGGEPIYTLDISGRAVTFTAG